MIDSRGKQRIVIVGFPEAMLAKEMLHFMSQEFVGKIVIEHPDTVEFQEDSAYIVSVNRDMNLREKLCVRLQGHNLATYIHPSVIYDSISDIGPGCWIGPFAGLYHRAKLQQHCLVGPNCMISHNTTIGDGCVLHPYAMIAGSCRVGSYCLFSIKSTVIDGISIGDKVTIGAGALVTKDITESSHYIGYPARKNPCQSR